MFEFVMSVVIEFIKTLTMYLYKTILQNQKSSYLQCSSFMNQKAVDTSMILHLVLHDIFHTFEWRLQYFRSNLSIVLREDLWGISKFRQNRSTVSDAENGMLIKVLNCIASENFYCQSFNLSWILDWEYGFLRQHIVDSDRNSR